ncbi:hypothetical protein [Flavobacterium sp. GCM10023249]|uniref:hypothetical protein n=1 Tax=unclassified Flavobacterium TaxID=196869 RepID=UPI00360B5382
MQNTYSERIMGFKFTFGWLFVFLLSGCFMVSAQINNRNIKIFGRKVGNEMDKMSMVNEHLLLFPAQEKLLFIEINNQKSWIVKEVNWNDWEELPQNTLVMLQPVLVNKDKTIVPLHKRDYQPFLLSNFTVNSFAKEDFESNIFSLSWGISENGVNSAQTSKKIISNNSCTNGTCSLIVSFDKKNSKIEHIALSN